jgi:Bacterial Ig domain
MTHSVRGLGLAASLVLVSTLAFVPMARSQSSPSTAANVYIQTQGPAGPVYGYSATSTGQLSAISGSPYKLGTEMVGSNKSQFFTLGHTLLHSYKVGSNGAIGSQLSEASLFDDSGSSCGGTSDGDDGAVLDHTGQYVYVLLQFNADWSCSAYQTYKINGDGSFTFVGDTEENWGDQSGEVNPAAVDLPSILGSESFAYADEFAGHDNGIIGLQRESSGTLQLIGGMNPVFNDTKESTPSYPDASPDGNYVVLQLYPYDSNPPQLGSFTVDSQGNLSSTNSSSTMPTSALEDPRSTFSPDGKMLVLYASQGPGNSGNGIEIYNFNGAAPLTLYKTLLTGTPIIQAAWDSSNHLYAISYAEDKLYVFTVTSTSVTEDSSISIKSPAGMVVVSQAASTGGGCTAPSSNGVNVCSPGEGATVTSPVSINAAATVSGGVYRFELWNGNTKLLSEDSGVMDDSLSLAPGTYKLTFDARNSSGTHEYATRDITVSQ